MVVDIIMAVKIIVREVCREKNVDVNKAIVKEVMYIT